MPAVYYKSPSARKVWIEIEPFGIVPLIVLSPSARKVWIEISAYNERVQINVVTFREEGVD